MDKSRAGRRISWSAGDTSGNLADLEPLSAGKEETCALPKGGDVSIGNIQEGADSHAADAMKDLEEQADVPDAGAEAMRVSLAIHTAGRCSPCLYFASAYGCRSAACRYCHLSHDGKAKGVRPEKKVRDEFKERVHYIFERQQAGVLVLVFRCLLAWEVCCSEDPAARRTALQNLAAWSQQNNYMRAVIIGRLNKESLCKE